MSACRLVADLALMTVAGRLGSIPLLTFMVWWLEAPLDMLGGVVLDTVFGSWTLVRGVRVVARCASARTVSLERKP